MKAYQDGDPHAFELLYQKTSSKLYAYLKKKLGKDTDDVFQLVFLKLHRSRSQYDSKYLFEQWLFVIARSVLLDYQKQKRRFNEGIQVDYSAEVEEIADPLSQNGVQASYSQVDEVLDLKHLSAEQNEVIKLRVLDDLTYGEIAEKLNRTEVGVRQLFSRAIKKLRAEGRG
ncbi:MAG: RNA polymerase sigma factor [Bdellovibrionales bacterium]|nr:RNA polymerase sigma factor [Bdellovibrionales bacterium]